MKLHFAWFLHSTLRPGQLVGSRELQSVRVRRQLDVHGEGHLAPANETDLSGRRAACFDHISCRATVTRRALNLHVARQPVSAHPFELEWVWNDEDGLFSARQHQERRVPRAAVAGQVSHIPECLAPGTHVQRGMENNTSASKSCWSMTARMVAIRLARTALLGSMSLVFKNSRPYVLTAAEANQASAASFTPMDLPPNKSPHVPHGIRVPTL